jgi:DNA repair exonuclease SbcCD ATPase subunit
MWNLKDIKIQDFFSHVDSEYSFHNDCCTLIVGDNKDRGGNNGAGKTTLFEAISVALTGRSLRDIKKESFINDEAESCLVKLSLYNNVTKHELEITRQFFRGNKSSKIEIIEDGEINSTITSVNEADKRILELIGIGREDLLRYYIISQDNVYTFFTAADNEKKEILNRITSADLINPLLEELSNRKKNLEEKKNELSKELVALDSKKETLDEQLEELKSNIVSSEEILDIQNRIKKLEKRKQSYLEDNNNIHDELKKLDGKNLDIDKLESKLKKIKKSIEDKKNLKDENKKIIRSAEQDLGGAVVCPKCGENFIPESELNLSVEDTKKILKEAEQENKSIETALSKLLEQRKDIQTEIDKAEEIQDTIKRKKREIKSNDDEIQIIDKKIVNRKKEIIELKKRKENNVAIKSIEDKIDECERKSEEVQKQIMPLDEELNQVNYWTYYMGKNGFKTYLANKAVSVLEGTVNSYLDKFNSDLSVNINGFKILKDGSVREKIESFVLESGMNPKLFMAMSGGERGRIKLAGILAIQHLINMSLNGNGLNLLILDESLSGIDSEGTMEFVNILENIGSTILLITQNIEDSKIFKNVLTVEKKNGVSRYIN